MGYAERVDRELFHRMLWNRTDSRMRVTFRLDGLGEEMQLSKYTISRLVNSFIREGRMARVTQTSTRGTTYKVADPDLFAG